MRRYWLLLNANWVGNCATMEQNAFPMTMCVMERPTAGMVLMKMTVLLGATQVGVSLKGWVSCGANPSKPSFP